MNFQPTERPKRKRNPSFIVDDRIHVSLKLDLALLLGDLIIDTNPTNPAILALGRRLQRCAEDIEEVI